MNDINWSLLPTDFKERYESLISCEHEFMTLEILREFDIV